MQGVAAVWRMGIFSLCVFCLRIYIAAEFLQRGVAKAADWHAAVVQFTLDFSLPLMSPVWSVGTFVVADFVFSMLLVLGAFMSSACAGLLMLNLAALIFQSSIWDLSRPDPLLFRLYSSACLLFLIAWGPGALSFDAFRRSER